MGWRHHRSLHQALSPQPAAPPHAFMPGSSAFLGCPRLPVEDDRECRLWEGTTIFIVWIQYLSWPSCCLLSTLFFSVPFSLMPSLLPSSIAPSLSFSLSSSAIKHTERNVEERAETPRVGRPALGNQSGWQSLLSF